MGLPGLRDVVDFFHGGNPERHAGLAAGLGDREVAHTDDVHADNDLEPILPVKLGRLNADNLYLVRQFNIDDVCAALPCTPGVSDVGDAGGRETEGLHATWGDNAASGTRVPQCPASIVVNLRSIDLLWIERGGDSNVCDEAVNPTLVLDRE